MSTLETQLEEHYKKIDPYNIVIGNKYLFVFGNYKIFGVFKNFHKREFSYKKYGELGSHICDISPTGYKVFSLQDIVIRQVDRYFRDIFPYEINIIIGKHLAAM